MSLIRRTLLLKDIASGQADGQQAAIVRAAACVVFANPFAGQGYFEDLSELFDMSRAIAVEAMPALTGLLDGAPVSYGKAAIVGTGGEMEHGAACLHPKLGAPMRAAISGGKALIPSNCKIGATGASIDVPLGHKDEAWSFDHFDTMTVSVPDAPLPGEIVLIIALADGGRPAARVGDRPLPE